MTTCPSGLSVTVYQMVKPVRRKVKAVGTWQRIYLGKGVGKRRDWLFERWKIALWAAFRSGCGSPSSSSHDSVREAKDPVTH